MNTNRKIHITVASVGLFISALLSVIGMFILPPKATSQTKVLFDIIAYSSMALFAVFAVYLAVAILNKEKEKNTVKSVAKILLYATLAIAALSLIIGGIITAIDFLALGAVMIVGGIALLALVIDLFAESAPEANKFVARISIGIGALIAITIITGFLLI